MIEKSIEDASMKLFFFFSREREREKSIEREQLADRARDHIVIVRFAVIHGIVRILGFLGTVIVFAPSSERKRKEKKGDVFSRESGGNAFRHF